MNLKYKLTLLGVALFATSFLVFYLTSQVVLMRSYQKLELQYIDTNLDRAKAALNYEIKSLSEKAKDWAVWDDTYSFATNQNESFLDTNINSTTYKSLKINAIIILNKDASIIHASGYDLEQDSAINFDENDLITVLNQANLSRHTLKDSSTNGIINFSGKVALVSSQPILTSDKEGPINGALIMLRFVDSALLRSISDLIKTPLEIFAINNEDLSPNLQTIKHTLLGGESFYFELSADQKDILAYTFVRNINSEPAAIIKITKPCEVKAIGEQAIHFYSVTIAIYILFALIMTLWIVNNLIIKRLNKLTRTIETINKHDDKTTRVVVRGDDEISELARSFNRMMDKFEHDK